MPFALVSLKGPNVKLESDDWNTLDEDHTKTINAVDGDTLDPAAPIIVNSGVLRIANTADLEVTNGGDIRVQTGAELLIETGGELEIQSGGNAIVNSGGTVTANSGSTVNIDGTENIRNGASLAVQSGGAVSLNAGSTTTVSGTLQLSGAGTNITYTSPSPRTFTRTASHVANFDGSRWAETVVPNTGYYESASIAAGSMDVITFAIDPPDGCTITEVSVWTDPPGAHAGEPGAKTKLFLYEQNVATGAAVTAVFSLTDPATVAGGTYEPAHAITQSGLATVVDKSTKTYFVVVQPESGANAIVGTKIWPPRFTFTRAKLGED